jgi:hypothetical protein
LYRVALVVDGRSWASKIINAPYFDIEWEGDVVTEKLEILMA